MSRIRNRFRFQSPEERVLNGILLVALVVLAAFGVSKYRDDQHAGRVEVKGIEVERPSPNLRPSVTPPPSSVATTTTTTIDPRIVFWTAVATRAKPSHPNRSTTTSTTATTGTTVGTTGVTTSSSTSNPTTTTTRSTPTTTTTRTTTTTSTPPISIPRLP